MTVATLLGAFIGYGADRVFGTKPWGLAIGVILGGAGGMLNVYWAAMEMTKEMEKEDKKCKDQDNSNGPDEIK